MTLQHTIALWKARLNLAGGYFSIISMPLLVVNLIQEKLKLVGINIPFLLLFAAAMLFILAVGYILDKTGFWEAENNVSYEKSGLMREEIKND